MYPNRIWALLLLAISLIILNNCTTSRYSQTSTNQLLSNKWATPKISPISVKIPFGWKEVDANDSTFFDLWMVSEDYNSSLSLVPIHSEKIKSLSEWVSASKLLNELKFKNNKPLFTDESLIELEGNKFSFYNFLIDNSYYRVSIFNFKNKYYELTAFTGYSSGNDYNITRIIEIQNAVLTSLK